MLLLACPAAAVSRLRLSRGAQLQRFCLLAAGYGEGLVKTSFSLRMVVGRQR